MEILKEEGKPRGIKRTFCAGEGWSRDAGGSRGRRWSVVGKRWTELPFAVPHHTVAQGKIPTILAIRLCQENTD